MCKKSICCSDCFNFIARNSVSAAKLWMNLCESVSNDIEKDPTIVVVAEENYVHVFTSLERMGFIVTTETSDYLVLKMNGIYSKRIGEICCCSESHSNHGSIDNGM